MVSSIRGLLLSIGLVVLLASSAGSGASLGQPDLDLAVSRVGALTPAHRVSGAFINLDRSYQRASYAARLRSVVFGRRWLPGGARIVALPVAATDVEALRENGHDATVTWIGHSTLLVQLDGVTFLTDPIWSWRTGPFGGLVGVKRYTPPPMPLEDLPPIDFVLISHDHYDHLDEPTVERLARLYHPLFIVPLGIRSWLADRGITRAVELDWGESVTVKHLTIVCTPAQHGSGRTLVDQGRRLWSSWAVLGTQRFYFGGDSGYARHFREIGDALGPFDLAALPIGSYAPREIARPVHMSPEEALQAWIDLRASRFVGIHWGTFGLAREPFDEPPRRLDAEVARRHLDASVIWTPSPGQTAEW